VNIEPAHWSEYGFYDYQEPWTLGIDDGLGVQFSSVSARLSSSQRSSHKRSLFTENGNLKADTDYLQNGGGSDSECKIERPSVDELFAIFFGLFFLGIFCGLYGLLYVNDKRTILRTSLVAIAFGCICFAYLFLIAVGIHPYSWGLPTKRHFHRCQETEYRQTFQHNGENVSRRSGGAYDFA